MTATASPVQITIPTADDVTVALSGRLRRSGRKARESTVSLYQQMVRLDASGIVETDYKKAAAIITYNSLSASETVFHRNRLGYMSGNENRAFFQSGWFVHRLNNKYYVAFVDKTTESIHLIEESARDYYACVHALISNFLEVWNHMVAQDNSAQA